METSEQEGMRFLFSKTPQYINHHRKDRIIQVKGKKIQKPHINNWAKLTSGKNHQGMIWAILITFFVFSPLIFYPFLVPPFNGSLSKDNENNDNSDWTEIMDDTIRFSAKDALKPKNNQIIRGTRGYSGTSPPVGDWNITGVAVVWNETITLNGNLTIEGTGNLTLINVTLKMNCSFNGEYHIEVLGGGELYIYDYDWDRSTTDDASNITAVDTAYKYLFWVQKDAQFEMRNSKLSWCGYQSGSNDNCSGLWINSNSVVIVGNLITNMRNGMTLYESNNHLIVNNTIYNNSGHGIYSAYSSGNNISNNVVFSNGYDGIFVNINSNNNILFNNTIFDNDFEGILINGVLGINITKNTIFDNYYQGIYLSDTSLANVRDNIIHNNRNGIHLRFSSSENQIINNFIYNNWQHGVYMYTAPNNILHNNTIYNSSWSGVYLYSWSSGNILSNNTV